MNLSYGENTMSDVFFQNFSFFGEKYYTDSVCPQVKMCLRFSPSVFLQLFHIIICIRPNTTMWN